MVEFSGIKNILWDFDGVLVDSHAIRKSGFVKVLKDFPEEEVRQLLDYHARNGGLSRYVKFRYFFEEIREEPVPQNTIDELSAQFSAIMKKKMTNRNILIEDSLNFVKDNYKRYNMHVVSGSDENELQFLCKKLSITQYFKSIRGSPTPKVELVKEIIEDFEYKPDESILIGDSVNDYDAAFKNGLEFYGYNKEELREKAGYIDSFS